MQRLLAVCLLSITTILGTAFAHAADDAAVRLNQVLLGLTSMQADFAQQTTDGKGRTLIPGLIDAHGHVMGLGLSLITLQNLAYNLAWVFSAALLLALPVVAATLVVQLGMGFLNRVAPALNLFSLGYSLVTLFGLFMLSQMLSHVPAHYLRMTRQLLHMIEQGMHAPGAAHG